MLAAAIPGMVAGAWLVTQAEPRLLQLLVGVIVLVGAAVQALAAAGSPTAPGTARRPALEVGGGFAAGVLTTSVTVNGPALVLVFGALGLRGAGFATRSPRPCSASACWPCPWS